MEKSQSRRNLVTAANATELATRTIMKVMGHDCAKTMGGQKITRQLVADSVAAKLGSHVNDSVRG
ncbi:hypothetical protein pVa21_168 [Vibrio phage pVa-21]|nr:hypothetical protein pVa21_168 [Vibrio phage pVa-21]